MAKRKRSPEPEDLGTNRSENPLFAEILAARLSRREVVRGGLGTLALTMLASGCGDEADVSVDAELGALGARDKLNFESVGSVPHDRGRRPLAPGRLPVQGAAQVRRPHGSLAGAPPFRSTGAARASNTGAEAELQFGDNHDGLEFFPLPFGSRSSRRGLLATNHESARAAVISGFRFVRSPDPALDTQHDSDAVRKQKAAQRSCTVVITPARCSLVRRPGGNTRLIAIPHPECEARSQSLEPECEAESDTERDPDPECEAEDRARSRTRVRGRL